MIIMIEQNIEITSRLFSKIFVNIFRIFLIKSKFPDINIPTINNRASKRIFS